VDAAAPAVASRNAATAQSRYSFAVAGARRQQLAQGGFVDLHDADSRGLQVADLVPQRQRHLLGGTVASTSGRGDAVTAAAVTGALPRVALRAMQPR
jgi:hypothetical protein